MKIQQDRQRVLGRVLAQNVHRDSAAAQAAGGRSVATPASIHTAGTATIAGDVRHFPDAPTE